MDISLSFRDFLVRVFCVLLLVSLVEAYAMAGEGDDHGRKGKKDAGVISSSGNGPSGVPVVDRLITEARRQYYNHGNIAAADSLASLAIQQAGMTYQTKVILHALNAWMGMYELGCDNAKAIAYAQEAEELVIQTDDPDIAWNTWYNLAQVWTNEFGFDKAIGFAHRSLASAESSGSLRMKTLSLIKIGNILHNNNQIIEGFRYYLNALTLAETSNDPELLIACYKTLSNFYDLNKGYEKAISYKMREIALLTDHKPVDSMALYWARTNLEEIYLSCNNKVHEEMLSKIILFAERKGNNYLKQYVLAMFRSYLMNNNLFERLRVLYQEQYPGELHYLSIQNPGIYYRLQAIFLELGNRIDSAYACYLKAEEIIVQDGSKVMASNFYIRFGEFLQRNGNVQAASVKFLQAFELADMTGYFEYALKAAKVLEEIYEKGGDYKEALLFAQHTQSISDSIARMNQQEEMLSLEIRNAEQIREIELNEAEQATRRRNNLQYTLILLLTLAIFAILVLLGNFRISATAVKILGFFSFIFLFEFIILLADKQIHHITHGEPLKTLGIKVVLIAFLLPLHHWAEKRVTHYLLNRKFMRFERTKVLTVLRNIRTTAREIWGK